MPSGKRAVRDIFLLAVGTFLYTVASPPYEWPGAAWLALTPLFLALRDKTPTTAFLARLAYAILMVAVFGITRTTNSPLTRQRIRVIFLGFLFEINALLKRGAYYLQSALSLANARAYGEIQELNASLEKKVEERTQALALNPACARRTHTPRALHAPATPCARARRSH